MYSCNKSLHIHKRKLTIIIMIIKMVMIKNTLNYSSCWLPLVVGIPR